MRNLFILFCLSLCCSLVAQETIDGSFQVQKVDKLYSLYIPSNYDATEAQSLMIGFHPLNTNRWNAQSWRDTLIQFAETNNLLLACPDGGPDGRVDDPIDTTFTTQLIDSLHHWYDIDTDHQYAIGFSWGARTAYTYSMNHPSTFKGVIPIGAAIDGTMQFSNVIDNAAAMTFFIVHGNNDSPNVRYAPVLSAFDQREVCYDSRLLGGVGHTIDFPNRNDILSEAFAFVQDDMSCMTSSTEISNPVSDIEIFPNPIYNGTIYLKGADNYEIEQYALFDSNGKMIYQYAGTQKELRTNRLASGVYILKILHKNGQLEFRKLVSED